LALDRNLANAHFSIGVGKTFIGRAEETEGHIVEALRLSPRDPTAHVWMNNAGLAKLFLAATSRRPCGVGGRSKPTEISRTRVFCWGPHSRTSVVLTRRIRLKTGLTLNPVFSLSRARGAWSAMSDEPTYLAQIEPVLEGLRKSGVPEQ
jgi:hypothetical protein